MLKLGRVKQLALFIQIFDDLRVRILYKGPCIGRLLGHIPLAVHKLHKGQVILTSHLGVVFTESRRNMNDLSW